MVNLHCIRAKSINDALSILNEYKGECSIIAGGTDIIIKLRKNEINPKVLLDINSIDDLKGIKEVGEYIEIGGATTFSEIANCVLFDKRFLGLKMAAKSVGSPQIRNRGTIGGNICNASPAADIVPPLLALDSILVLESLNEKREVFIRDFFKDKGKTVIKENEILTKIRFKNITKNQGLGFSKLGLRKSLAISRISFSVFLEIDDLNRIEMIRAASGAIGKYPMREYKLEEFLIGRILDEKTLKEAGLILQKDVLERLGTRQTAKFKSIASLGEFKKALYVAQDACKGVKNIEKN